MEKKQKLVPGKQATKKKRSSIFKKRSQMKIPFKESTKTLKKRTPKRDPMKNEIPG